MSVQLPDRFIKINGDKLATCNGCSEGMDAESCIDPITLKNIEKNKIYYQHSANKNCYAKSSIRKALASRDNVDPITNGPVLSLNDKTVRSKIKTMFDESTKEETKYGLSTIQNVNKKKVGFAFKFGNSTVIRWVTKKIKRMKDYKKIEWADDSNLKIVYSRNNVVAWCSEVVITLDEQNVKKYNISVVFNVTDGSSLIF